MRAAPTSSPAFRSMYMIRVLRSSAIRPRPKSSVFSVSPVVRISEVRPLVAKRRTSDA